MEVNEWDAFVEKIARALRNHDRYSDNPHGPVGAEWDNLSRLERYPYVLAAASVARALEPELFVEKAHHDWKELFSEPEDHS